MTLTDQQFFTDSIEFLRNQEHKAVDADGKCQYRSPHGPCVIGRLVDDDHPMIRVPYAQSVDEIFFDYPDLTGTAWPDTENGVTLAACLQWLHDIDGYRTETGGGLSPIGERRAAGIATTYGLTYTPPGKEVQS